MKTEKGFIRSIVEPNLRAKIALGEAGISGKTPEDVLKTLVNQKDGKISEGKTSSSDAFEEGKVLQHGLNNVPKTSRPNPPAPQSPPSDVFNVCPHCGKPLRKTKPILIKWIKTSRWFNPWTWGNGYYKKEDD